MRAESPADPRGIAVRAAILEVGVQKAKQALRARSSMWRSAVVMAHGEEPQTTARSCGEKRGREKRSVEPIRTPAPWLQILLLLQPGSESSRLENPPWVAACMRDVALEVGAREGATETASPTEEVRRGSQESPPLAVAASHRPALRALDLTRRTLSWA